MNFNFPHRLKKLRAALKKEKLDALVVLTVEGNNKNVYYLSGFGGTTGVLAVSKTKVALAVDPRYTTRAKKEAQGVRVIEIPKGKRGEYMEAYVETALGGLAPKARARIGIEGARVSTLATRHLEKNLKKKFVPTKSIVEKLRQVKDAEEIKALAHAGKVTSEVFTEVAKEIRADMRESDISQALNVGLMQRGVIGFDFDTTVASGANSAIPHHETSERRVKAGEPVVMDFGGIFPGGYCSDLTRTVFVPGKKPNKKLVEAYAIVLEANRRALRALKPGLTWKEYDAVARDYIKERGYGKYFTHGLGHSLGLEAHDPYDYAHDAFQAGTVLSNEPGIYIEDLGGIRIEDDVVVTKTGAKRLTPAPYLLP